MPLEQGPYLQLAAFCENVIQDKEGILTLVRVIDRVTQTASGPGAPESLQPFEHEMYAVISLKAGQARGRHELKIVRELPSGIKEDAEAARFSIHFEGEGDRGHNVIVRYRQRIEIEGLYWFDVYLNDQLVTRMPFRVLYARIAGPAA